MSKLSEALAKADEIRARADGWPDGREERGTPWTIFEALAASQQTDAYEGDIIRWLVRVAEDVPLLLAALAEADTLHAAATHTVEVMDALLANVRGPEHPKFRLYYAELARAIVGIRKALGLG